MCISKIQRNSHFFTAKIRGYYIYIPENTMTAENDLITPVEGTDIISTYELPRSILQIEVIKDMDGIEAQKQIAIEELRSFNPNQEPVETEHPDDEFFDKTLFHISNSLDYEKKTIFMIPINGQTYKFTLHYVESEFPFVTVFYEIIKTIGTVEISK